MSLEDLIARSQVWRGAAGHVAPDTIATGFSELDRALPGGGWPRNAITEIISRQCGLGELSLLMPALAALGRQDGNDRRWIVWIAPPLLPYAPALALHGVDLKQILLVHPRGADRDALWAAEQALRSGSSVAVLAWLSRAGDKALRRLQIGAEECRCLTVLFRPLAALSQGSPAALRLALSRTRCGTRVELIKCRGREPAALCLDLAPPAVCSDAPEPSSC